MEYKSFIITLILIVIPLIILVLLYKNYVYNHCENDMKCIKNKLTTNLNNLNNKIKNMYASHVKEEKEKENEIEGFFGGLGNWFSGSNPSNLPIAQTNDGSIIEKKINDDMIKSTKFPPSGSDDFEDSSNADLLASVGVKPNNENTAPKAVFDKSKLVQPKRDVKIIESAPAPQPMQPKLDVKSLLGKCQFYNDKCPDNYHQLGNFSVEGTGAGNTLTCGNVQNTKPAHAIAQIKNNSVYEIHITDQGHGFNPDKAPKVTIEGGKGNGATAEAVVGDDGFLKLIKVVNPGYNYTETPTVLIDAPYMNSSCHLCCEGNII